MDRRQTSAHDRGTLVRGEVSGEAKLTNKAGTYIGTLRQGIPHGQGYFEYANHGGWYEGAIVDGKYEGAGVFLASDRSRYTGYWKAGKRHGFGEETFGLGGSYKGHWENDVFHGRSTMTYAGSGRKYEGEFRAGRIAGSAPLEVDTKRYVMKEIPRVGSHLPEERAMSLFPPAAKWENLSELQKNTLRAMYPALERGDDPPYPLYNTGELYQAVLRQTELHDGVLGKAGVLVVIGADGKPKQAMVVSTTNPQLARVIATTMMVQKYKPASCQGKPCEMAYAVDLDYGIH
ncbi:MAG: hypothetical protein V7631_967 [Massilia sp.]|jgi:hypothetical protein